MLIKIIVCLIAGAGAGFGTGLAGLSAAAVIAPMLITFLDVNAYEAVGIALASDVLASAASAYTYKKNHNIDIKNGLIMLVSVLVFTLAGNGDGSFLFAAKMERHPRLLWRVALTAIQKPVRFVYIVALGSVLPLG